MRATTMRPLLLVGVSFLALAAGLSARADDEAPKPASAPPNVVLIIADDMAWTDFGFMGHPIVRTPRLDRLASQSLTYRRGYVTTSLCSPSLASIFSGKYPHQNGITSNDPPLPPGMSSGAAARDKGFLEARAEMLKAFDEMPSLPRQLADKGYLSFQAGKWWGGSHQRAGFTHGMTHGDPERGGRHGDAGLAIGRRTMKPIFTFIELAQQRKAPFFLWYAPMMPHLPHTPPDRFLEHYKDKTPSLEVAKYWAMCEWFDETCGQLLDFLDERKIADNTLVIFLADNGWIQDPNGVRYAPRSKQSQYDGGLRTPVLVRWPGKVQPRTSDALVSSLDLVPTVLKAAGVGPKEKVEGVDFLDDRAVAARKAVYGDIYTHNAVKLHDPAASLRFRWVVAGDWKLIVPDRRNEPNGVVELYDVVHDPGEAHNLAAKEPRRVAELNGLLDQWWRPVSPEAAP